MYTMPLIILSMVSGCANPLKYYKPKGRKRV